MFETPESIPNVNLAGGQSAATYRGNDALAVWRRKHPEQSRRISAFAGMLDRLNARADASFEAGQRSVDTKLEASAAIAQHDEYTREHGDTPQRVEERKALVLARAEASKAQEAAQEASRATNQDRGATRDAYNRMMQQANALAASDAKPRSVGVKMPIGSAVDVASQCVARLGDLRAERQRIANAVDAKDDAHRAIVDQCMRLADEGRAGMRVTLGGRRGPTLRLPVEVVAAESRGDAVPTATDAGALIAAMFPEQFERAALEALDRAYATAGLVALDAQAKAKRLKAIDADILMQERILAEAALAAYAQHFDVALPSNISPEALLGIE